MKRWLLILLAVLGLTALLGYMFRDVLGFMVMSYMTTPGNDFSAGDVPDAPDYANADHWAALPDRKDDADYTAQGERDLQASAQVDVFFVHPTTFYKNSNWNQPLDDADANRFTREGVLRGQASVFNSCCRVYAPFYRQATLGAFFDQSGNGDQALEVAYADVERAFDYFIEHYSQGRPFVLAAHSQGSLHLQTLIERRISNSPLLARLVVAYPIGYRWDQSTLARKAPDLTVCDAPESLTCVITWNAVGPNAAAFGDTSDQICVNPLSWHHDSVAAPHTANLGTLWMAGGGELLPEVADAQCQDGRLLVSELRSDKLTNTPINFGRDNYHVLDYSLFYKNLRRNAEARVIAYLEAQANAAEEAKAAGAAEEADAAGAAAPMQSVDG